MYEIPIDRVICNMYNKTAVKEQVKRRRKKVKKVLDKRASK